MAVPAALLEVLHLTVAFERAGASAPAVDDVCFSIGEGETLGLVGESGSGKSLTALSILGLVPPPGRIVAGRVMFRGRNLLALPHGELRQVRGRDIGIVFQEPMTALNPVFRVGAQVAEVLEVHGRASGAEAQRQAVEWLDRVRVPNAAKRARDYPHQLSGGLQQRVVIAMALACGPSLLIADEPTTALDVTIQAEILDLLAELREAFRLSMLLISHDLGIIAASADHVAVMHRGRIVERAPVREIFRAPVHPYTRSLLAAVPRGAAC